MIMAMILNYFVFRQDELSEVEILHLEDDSICYVLKMNSTYRKYKSPGLKTYTRQNSEYFGQPNITVIILRLAFNPHLPSGFFHLYLLDESISNFRDV